MQRIKHLFVFKQHAFAFTVLVLLAACNNNPQSKPAVEATKPRTSDTIIQPATAERINREANFNNKAEAFKLSADSILGKAINKTDVQYTLNNVKWYASKQQFVPFFHSVEMEAGIGFSYTLKRPYTQYDFSVGVFTYASAEEARRILNIAAVAENTAVEGLDKCGLDLFVAGNNLYYLRTPCSLSGKSFTAYSKAFRKHFAPDSGSIETMEGLVKVGEIKTLKTEPVNGNWQPEHLCQRFRIRNESMGGDYEKAVDFSINGNQYMEGNQTYDISRIIKVDLPDMQAYFLYDNVLYDDNQELNPKLGRFNGAGTLYTIHIGQNGKTLKLRDFFCNGNTCGILTNTEVYLLTEKR